MLRVGLLLLAVASLHAADLNRDGLDDALEQRLSAAVLPVFLVSGGECDVAPAEFVACVASNFRSIGTGPMLRSRVTRVVPGR